MNEAAEWKMHVARAKAAIDAACKVFANADEQRKRAEWDANSHRHDWIKENPFAKALADLGELPDDWLDPWIARAKADRGAFDLARIEAAKAVLDGKPLSPAARCFVVSVLLDVRKRPDKKRGAPPKKTRDQALILAVAYLAARHGLHKTRNDESPPYSACDAVAEALGRRYGTVKDVWLRCQEPGLWPVGDLIGAMGKR